MLSTFKSIIFFVKKINRISLHPDSETGGQNKVDSPRAESSPLHQRKKTNSILHGQQNRGLRVIIVSSVVFALAITVALILTIYLEPRQVHGHAAVACDDVRCSEVSFLKLEVAFPTD